MPERIKLSAMLHTAHAIEAEVETRLGEVGLSGAKFAALQALAEAGESLPLTQLAERLSCVKSNITQLVDRLEAHGLVARQADSRDRRTRLAALTPAGRKAVKDGTRALDAAERDVLGRLSRDEGEQLRKLLGKIGQR
jgi:DNA-binding MarR family transcriptional regulator